MSDITINTKGSNAPKDGYEYKETPLEYSAIESQVKFLQGKVLTVIEASITSEAQQKAVKDLIKKMFSEQLSWIADLCYPELPMYSREKLEAMGLDVDKMEAEAEELK